MHGAWRLKSRLSGLRATQPAFAGWDDNWGCVVSIWPELHQQLVEARCPVEVLPANQQQAKQAMQQLRVSPESVLGTVATHSGGILFEQGWLRLLGSGHERLRGTLLAWNGLGQDAIGDPLPAATLFAHDALGGFFALNQGAFAGGMGVVHYFAPDTLEWEPLHDSYNDFLAWVVLGSLRDFYQPFLWSGWEEAIGELPADRGYSIYPPLWAAGPDIGARSRRAVPMTELWSLQRDLAGKLADLPDGATVRLHVVDD